MPAQAGIQAASPQFAGAAWTPAFAGVTFRSSCQRRLASRRRLGHAGGMKPGWVYIMTNKPFGTLYVGVTSDLSARVHQHRTGTGSGFCKQYDLNRLVYMEPHGRIDDAIAREKAMKAWQRRWKTRLIEEHNPQWKDLFETLNG